MTLALARCLEDPEALWQEIEAGWQRGCLVGLAPPGEQPLLMAAVLGEAAGAHRNSPRAGSSEPGQPVDRERPGAQPAETLAARGCQPPLRAAERHKQHLAPGRGDAEPPSLRQAAECSGADTALTPEPHDRWGPALVLGSGGSSGGRRWCLQPLSHLQASAQACGAWLAALGIEPGRCLHLDALPLHHVSGLMPLIRARQWRAELRWLPPELLRHPAQLPMACPLPGNRPVLLSLVPTQLHRLLDSPEAIDWLKHCALIWVGGAALSPDLAARAREAALPLAPCYGATETAAMICALPPQRFLAGEQGCGAPLGDVELRLEGDAGAIAVRSARLSPGWFAAGRLHPFHDPGGWWRSGDAGVWQPAPRPAGMATAPARGSAGEGAAHTAATSGDSLASRTSLVILGRLDGAIHSGGETVFPDQVRQRLLGLIRTQDLPVAELLLLAESDPLWGERLVALVRWQTAEATAATARENIDTSSGRQTGWLSQLADLARALPAPQRPRRWLPCPDLQTSVTGKWELQRWKHWLETHDAGKT